MKLFSISVLMILDKLGDNIHACILSPSLSRIINTLIENNFIIKKEDKLDKRKIILEISDEGKLKLESIKPEYIAILKSIQKRYGEDKINKILNLLTEIIDWRSR